MKKIHSRMILVFSFFLLACLGVNSQENEEIRFTQVPDWGNTWMNLKGKVNVNPQEYRVAGVIFVEEAGGWWTKPSFANPSVSIGADSTFILDFTTGGLDAFCTRLIAVLIPNGFTVPLFSGAPDLPADLLQNPYTIAARPHGDRLIEWHGIDWTVKRSVNGLSIGPGPNVFSSAENQVYIDEESCLHLKIVNNGNGLWLCSELIADTSFGYGTYTFNMKSRVDNNDDNSVTGLFTWDDISKYSKTAPDNFYREYDIEFSYWSEPANDVSQYVVQPYYNPGNMFRFPMGSEMNTIHQWIWKKDTIIFRSLTEDSTLIAEFEYTGSDFHYPDIENVRLNLWMINGMAPLTEQEVIISGFEFRNILASPQNVSASEGDTLKVTLTWDSEPGNYYGIYRSTSDIPLNAVLLTDEWTDQNFYEDSLAEPNVLYYYWVRASDNILGSNTTGYASGYSDYDTGWATDNTLSVNDCHFAVNFQVLPNPCKDYAKIHYDSNMAGLFQLFDSRGNLVMCKMVIDGEVLRTANLSPGLYFAKLSVNNRSFSKKIVISI